MYSLLRPFTDKDFHIGKESVNELWITVRDIYQKFDYDMKSYSFSCLYFYWQKIDLSYRKIDESPEPDGTEIRLAHCNTLLWIVVKLNFDCWVSSTLILPVISFIPRRRARCWLNSCSFRKRCSNNSPTWEDMVNDVGWELLSNEISNDAGWVLSLKSMPIDATFYAQLGKTSISSIVLLEQQWKWMCNTRQWNELI